MPRGRVAENLVGRQFGNLTVVARNGSIVYGNNSPQPLWRCQCSCPARAVVDVCGGSLRSGHTTSCGCLGRAAGGVRNATHRRSGTRLYHIWQNMRRRCLCARDLAYPRYGGRGITVCDRWKDSFENFLADMGDPPTDKHTLDRIDNSGNYEPGNCRWATYIQQGRNSRKNHPLTHGGRTQPISAWAEELGMAAGTLKQRIRRGWPAGRALTEPLRVWGNKSH